VIDAFSNFSGIQIAPASAGSNVFVMELLALACLFIDAILVPLSRN